MASKFFASTPTSRRTRRKQQKLRNRNHPTEATRQHTSQRTEIDQYVKDAGSANNPAAKFDVDTDGHQVNPASNRSRTHNSNPFSLLDVSIPSPTLSTPSPRQDFVGWDWATWHNDHYGTEKAPTTNLPISLQCKNSQKQLRRDEWASPLQQNTVITKSEDSTHWTSTAADPASVKSLRSMAPETCGTSITSVLPRAGHEDAFSRVPSPLLYHRRSKEASSEPVNLQLQEFTPSSQSVYRHNTAQSTLLSGTRTSGQQEESLPINKNTSRFIAARLPLMDNAQSCSKSKVEDLVVSTGTLPNQGADYTLSTIACTLPILTTTNTYIFPKRVYNAHCQPNAAWSGPSYTDTQCSWKSTRNLMFPKLSIPGSKLPSKSSLIQSDTDSGNMMIRHRQSPLVEQNSAWLKTSLSAPLPELLDFRCRSSTQDSFDSKFNVSTATKQLETPVIGSVSMQQSSDHANSAEGLFDAESEKVPVTPTNESSWTGGTIEWSLDACNTQGVEILSNLEVLTTSVPETSDVALKLDQELTTLDPNSRDEHTPEQSQGVWLDYYASHDRNDDDIGSEVHVDVNDIEVHEDSWTWDDKDDWETIASTPATELDGQLEFDEHEWKW